MSELPETTMSPDDGASPDTIVTPETVMIATAVAIYARAFLDELGKRTGDAVANLPKWLADVIRVRRRAREGKPDEYIVGTDDEETMIVVTEDTPDEARLALLDLDVTAEQLWGKTLRWDAPAGAWVPDDEASPTA
jgi:hypothetical protein